MSQGSVCVYACVEETRNSQQHISYHYPKLFTSNYSGPGPERQVSVSVSVSLSHPLSHSLSVAHSPTACRVLNVSTGFWGIILVASVVCVFMMLHLLTSTQLSLVSNPLPPTPALAVTRNCVAILCARFSHASYNFL